ncbi:hypothetical protein Sjap_020078 [Stephania japonica]|uniref:X8 domain-containing protein n=1 Tax=Stephania japonica TaxID=461633 RepID=A0AAP0I0E1_9MAGN
MSTTDYAYGAGADCEEIRPQGRCYHPDTVVPHASYAFSDYWQMKKRIGATCDFGGTAMIISSSPRVTVSFSSFTAISSTKPSPLYPQDQQNHVQQQ